MQRYHSATPVLLLSRRRRSSATQCHAVPRSRTAGTESLKCCFKRHSFIIASRKLGCRIPVPLRRAMLSCKLPWPRWLARAPLKACVRKHGVDSLDCAPSFPPSSLFFCRQQTRFFKTSFSILQKTQPTPTFPCPSMIMSGIWAKFKAPPKQGDPWRCPECFLDNESSSNTCVVVKDMKCSGERPT